MNGTITPLHAQITDAVLSGRVGRPENLAVLCADHLACRGRTELRGGWRDDGLAGEVAEAAMRGHHGDLDDIHWPTLTHPGSVVWPVVLGIAAVAPTPGVEVARAASAGYDMTAAVADVIAASGVTGIHRTSVAGHAGAAIAAALLLGDGDGATDAVGLALAVAGGVGQTIDERAAAGGFHRASAAVAGVHAARAARSGMSAPSQVLEGRHGLVAMLGGANPVATDLGQAVADDTCLRVHPTNGFLQAAFQAVAVLAARAPGAPDEIEVVLHPAAIGALDDRWPRWTIASLRPAWVGPTTDAAGPRFTVVEGDVALGAALVRVLGEGVADEAAVGRDFTASGRIIDATLAKWNVLGLPAGHEVVDRLARQLGDDAPFSLAQALSTSGSHRSR